MKAKTTRLRRNPSLISERRTKRAGPASWIDKLEHDFLCSGPVRAQAMAAKALPRLIAEIRRLEWTCPDCGAHASNKMRCGGMTFALSVQNEGTGRRPKALKEEGK